MFVIEKKTAAIFLSFYFTLCNSVSYTAPSVHSDFIPQEYAQVEESFAGTSGKTIYYIQDAHDSLEAQENIAGVISHLIAHTGVKTIYEEGYEGQVPTDEYFGFIQHRQTRLKAARYLLDKLVLGAAEYVHITSDQAFTLWGADNIKLHLQSIEAYRRAAQQQMDIRKELTALYASLQQRMLRTFPREFKDWLGIKKRYDKNQIDAFQYAKSTWELILERDKDLPVEYPVLGHALQAALNKAAASDGDDLNKIDATKFYEEVLSLEKKVASHCLRHAEDRRLFEMFLFIQQLNRLNDLQMTPDEFEVIEQNLGRFRTKEIGELLLQHTGKPVVLSRQWETGIQSAVQFYRLSHRRDAAIAEQLDAFMRQKNESSAVIVFGGFHKESIRRLLRERNLSYVIMTPRITQQDVVHQQVYRQIMAFGTEPHTLQSIIAKAARAPSMPYYEGLTSEGRSFAKAELRVIADTVEMFPDLEEASLHLKIDRALLELKNSFRPELRAVLERIPEQFTLKDIVNFLIPHALRNQIRMELGDPSIGISKQPYVYLVSLANPSIRLRVDIDEAQKRYAMTFIIAEEGKSVVSLIPMFTEYGALRRSIGLFLQDSFRAFYDAHFGIPLKPGPERKAAIRAHLEMLVKEKPDLKRHIPPTSTDGYLQFWGRLNLPGYYYKHAEEFAAITDRAMQPRFIMIYQVANPDNYVIYEYYGDYLESAGVGERIAVQNTDDKGKKLRKGYRLRLYESSAEFRAFDEQIKTNELKLHAFGSESEMASFHVDEAGFKFYPLAPVQVWSYAGRRQSFSKVANPKMKNIPTLVLRSQDKKGFSAKLDNPTDPTAVLIDGITNGAGDPVRFGLHSYYNLSVVMRLIDLGELPGVYASDLVRSIVAPYPEAVREARNPRHHLRGYVYQHETNFLIPEGHVSSYTFEFVDHEPQPSAHAERPELRFVAANLDFRLMQPAVFAMTERDLGSLSGDEWRELLTLKGISPKQLKIMILNRRKITDPATDRRIQELQSFGDVYEENQRTQLPRQAVQIRFGNNRPELRLAAEKIRSDIYSGAFGLALLFAVNETRLPGVSLDSDGFIHDATRIWASRALQMLTDSYAAISQAA